MSTNPPTNTTAPTRNEAAYIGRVKRIRFEEGQVKLGEVTQDEEKEIMDAIYAVEATLKTQLAQVRRHATNSASWGSTPSVGFPSVGFPSVGLPSVGLGSVGNPLRRFGGHACAGLYGMMKGMCAGLYGMRTPMGSMLKAAGTLGIGMAKFGMGAVSGIQLPSHSFNGTEIHPSQFALPDDISTNPAALQGAYIGLATAASARWMSTNSARVALYALALVMLVLLITGMYLYSRDYHRYEQAKKEQALGVVTMDTQKVRKEMEEQRNEAQIPAVQYVQMTPPDYGQLP